MCPRRPARGEHRLCFPEFGGGGVLVGWRSGCARHGSDFQTNARVSLKGIDHGEQVGGCRVALRSEHPHETLGRCLGRLGKSFKANRCVDVGPQRDPPFRHITFEEGLDAVLEQRLPKSRVAFGSCLNRELEVLRQCHALMVSYTLPFFKHLNLLRGHPENPLENDDAAPQ